METSKNDYTRTGDANISINNITPGEQNMQNLQKMINKTSSWGVNTKSKQKQNFEKMEEDKKKEVAEKKNAELENEQAGPQKRSLFRQRMEKPN